MANREGVTAGQTQAETDTTWMRFCFTVDEDAPFTRENVQQFLLDRGVATRMVWTGNILRQPGFADITHRQPDEGLPNCDRLWTVPYHSRFIIASTQITSDSYVNNSTKCGNITDKTKGGIWNSGIHSADYESLKWEAAPRPLTSANSYDAGADVLKLESPVGDPFEPGQRQAPPSLMVKTQHGGDSSTQAKEVSPLTWKPTKVKTNSTTSLRNRSHTRRSHPPGCTTTRHHLRGHPHHFTVHCSRFLTHFGTTGPWANRPANDFILQALTGATENRGIPEKNQLHVEENSAILSHRIERTSNTRNHPRITKTGTGTHIDVSQYESMMLASKHTAQYLTISHLTSDPHDK